MIPTNKVLLPEKPDYLSPSFNNKNKQLREYHGSHCFLKYKEKYGVCQSLSSCCAVSSFDSNGKLKLVVEG